jgi:rhodanese-related sulfurtransferase
MTAIATTTATTPIAIQAFRLTVIGFLFRLEGSFIRTTKSCLSAIGRAAAPSMESSGPWRDTSWAMPEEKEGSHVVARSLKPEAAWNAVQLGFAEILDLRTEIERRRYGAPPRARPVSLVKHIASPEGPGAIYLCQHAIRSKATLRRGASEVAGGFAAWNEAGLPVDEVE